MLLNVAFSELKMKKGKVVLTNRGSINTAYCAITGILKPYLSAVDYQKMTEDYGDSEWVDKLPNTILAEIHDDLVSILNAYCIEGTSMQYAWGSIKNNLLACHFYISSSGVLIRPLIPPTLTHRAFAEAKQRIYMSATLGRGGDLERLVGVKKIFRLPIPDGWEKQGIGRRFYIFPERSLDDPKENIAFILEAIKMCGRSVILTRNEDAAKDYEKIIKTSIGYPVFHARDIEESKNVFLNEKNAVAIMANRYDGVDFAEEESRMLLIDDLPTSTNLQERFFVSRMAANALLNERILTRVIQAMGRCTRSSTDYSAVIVAGERLVGYLLQQKTRTLLHPELQAELQFGIEQSKDADISTLLSYLDVFLRHDSAWFGADEEIMSLRDGLTQSDPSYLLNLEQSVAHEVEYQYKLWSGDFLSAANEAKAVLDSLTDSDLRGYRALWNYLVGSAYMKSGAQYRTTAKEYFEVAMKGAPSLSWLVKLAKMTFDGELINTYSDDIGATIDNFEQKIINLGLTSNRKYDAFEKSIYDGLRGDSKQFELAQKNLGELIGYRAGKIETDASPDPWWQLSEKMFIVFEDFTDAQTTTELCATKARQSATHDNWLREKLVLGDDVEIIKVLVTSVKKAKDGALPHLKDVYLWERDKFVEWALKILPTLRELKMKFGSEGDMSWRANAAEIYDNAGLSIASMSSMVKRINAYQYFSGKLDI